MNSYKCFYKGKTVDVMANTTYGAQMKAAILLNARKSSDVVVLLCELGGKQFTHSTGAL